MMRKLTPLLGVLVLLLWAGAFAQRGPLLLLRPGAWSLIAPSELAPIKIFSVTSYGAVGDGTTNDSGAFANALAACGAAGGGVALMTRVCLGEFAN